MLLENNVSGNMNGLALIISLIFLVGIIITYVVIIYLMDHPKKKRLMMTYSAKLREHTQNHSINYLSNRDDTILLVNQE